MRSIDKAYDLYVNHIYEEEKISLLLKHRLKIAGSVPFVMWELFGAILTESSGDNTAHTDLIGWEVKSARLGASFEYQYKFDTGAEKLNKDCKVNHLFFTYSETYKNVIVRAISGKVLAKSYFINWENNHFKDDGISYNLKSKQRLRKVIPLGYIESNGELIMEIENGIMKYRNDEVIPSLNSML